MFCTNCGKELYPGDKYCARCGNKVRVEEPAAKPKQNVVFNPPFRVEAEKRTAEIFRGFEDTTEEKATRQTAPADFDWNLDGFPKTAGRKTEEIDFNWDSVVEKRNSKRITEEIPAIPVVDKIDFSAREKKTEPVDFDWGDLVRRPKQAVAEPVKEEPVKEVVIQPEPVAEEPPMSIEDLEKELFGENYRPLGGGLSHTGEQEKSKAKLEKFYTYNEKKEAFQELLDKEYERLKGMEDGRKPEEESLQYTWAHKIFPVEEPETEDVKKEELHTEEILEEATPAEEKTPVVIVEEPATKSETADQKEKKVEISSDTIDFSPIREEARKQKQVGPTPDEPAEHVEIEPEIEPEPVVKAVQEEVNPEPDEKSGEDIEETVLEETTATSEEADIETEKTDSREDCAEVVVMNQEEEVSEATEEAEGNAQETQEAVEADVQEADEDSSPSNETESEPAEPKTDAAPEPGTVEPTEPEPTAEINDAEEEKHVEKTKLRYSDVFPGKIVDDDSDDGSVDGTGSTAKKFKGFVDLDLDDDDEEEPHKAGFLVKLVIGILIVLMMVEGVILLTKLIAPDSEFSLKVTEITEMLMDKLKGEDPEETEYSNLGVETFIGDILDTKVEVPETIGKVAEDVSLKYDMEKEYAFRGIPGSKEFTDSTWKTTDDGAAVSYGEGILSAVVSYYSKWQETNTDTSLIGINKLEIGEIRTGGEGYYVLCRLTFAATDGVELVKYETAYVKISQNSMVINEIKEESI